MNNIKCPYCDCITDNFCVCKNHNDIYIYYNPGILRNRISYRFSYKNEYICEMNFDSGISLFHIHLLRNKHLDRTLEYKFSDYSKYDIFISNTVPIILPEQAISKYETILTFM